MRPLLGTLLLLSRSSLAWPDSTLSAGALVSGDNQRYAWQAFQAEWRRETPASSQWLGARWHRYSLGEEFAGVFPFRGNEPSARLGAHVLRGLWWCAASLGFQGTVDLEGAIANLVVARAIPVGAAAITPRLELAREPLGTHPLPLSLGIASHRAEALVAWRSAGWTGEGGVRLDFWEAAGAPGRVQNGALDRIEATWLTTIHGYLLTQRDGWFDWGLAAKAAWSSRNTLLATQVQPFYGYSWYPASAPPFLWETALVLRAKASAGESLRAALQVQLPVVSRETRQWESERQSFWGTAPLEARLEASWWFLSATALVVDAKAFAKPWEDWDLFADGAYRQASVELALKQRI